MAEFLLVHGSCHGAWCWRDLIPELAALGHVARAIDLPGMGDDPTPIEEVTFDHYRHSIQVGLDAFDGPVVLVGHSAAGYPISAVAGALPAKIARLVYLCAYVPSLAKSMIDRRFETSEQPLHGALERSADRQSYWLNDSQLRRCMYGKCSDEQITFARRRLRPQPIAPQQAVVDITPALRGVAKSYIRCLSDGTIPPDFQARMADAWPEMTRHDMDSDHSPFFSRPMALAALLDRIASQ